MANVFLIGVEWKEVSEIASAVSVDRHTVCRRTQSIEMAELAQADIVFAGGTLEFQLSLVQRVRRCFPRLAFVMVRETMPMEGWLDAIEAGATDYCCAPVTQRQIREIMEALAPMRRDELKIMLPRGGRAAGEERQKPEPAGDAPYAVDPGMAPVLLSQHG